MREMFAILALVFCSAASAVEMRIPPQFAESCSAVPSMVEKVERDLQEHFPKVVPVYEVVVDETPDDEGSFAYQGDPVSVLHLSDKLCRSPRLEQSLRHEMTHILSYWEMGRSRYLSAPRWYREGLAILVSGQWETEFTAEERAKARRTMNRPFPDGSLDFEGYARAAALVEFLQTVPKNIFHRDLTNQKPRATLAQ